MFPKFILGSSSNIRLALLKQIGFVPDIVESPSIDEKPLKKEKPLDYVKRIAKLKAETINQKFFGHNILSADTIVNYQSLIIQKPTDENDLMKMLHSYSNRSVKVITSIYFINSFNKRIKKTIITSLKFKTLNKKDIEDYILYAKKYDYNLLNCCGGILIETILSSFVTKIVGSYSNIQGLPLYETRNILISSGIKNNLL